MGEREITLAAAAAFFSGRGYYVNTNLDIPGTDITPDLVAVIPRMRELKPRLKRGFAPVGVLIHLIENEWFTLGEIEIKTGYNLNFISIILDEAIEEGWVDVEVTEKGPKFRLKDYRIPVKECTMVFIGRGDFERNLKDLEILKKCCHKAYFAFPYLLDGTTTEQVVNSGAGILRYYQAHGIFQELVPAQINDIEDLLQFGLLAEKVLCDNIRIMMGEII